MQKNIELQVPGGFGPLLCTYLANKNDILPSSPVIDEKLVRASVEKRGDFAHREILYTTIKKQYEGCDISDAVRANIERLRNKNSFSITTGHQLSLMGGPLFVTYKILTTVKLAAEYKNLSPDNDFIPVFWMATEDHDSDEINHFYFRGEKFTWETSQTGAVGRFYCDGILPLIEHFSAQFPGMQENLLEVFKKAYSQPSLAKATAYLVNALFGQYGVICIDADDRALKALFLPVAIKEIEENFVHGAVTSQNRVLEKAGFTPAINPRENNLFLHTLHDRKRLENDDQTVKTADDSMSWDKKAFIDFMRVNPQDISPNVLLRPVYQELILPNLVYVGGPAETEYWLQLDQVFESLGMAVPARILRICATVIPANDAEKMDRTGLELSRFFEDDDKLTRSFLEKIAADALDFSTESTTLTALFTGLAEKAKNIDPTLEPAVMAEKARQEKALENIFGRIRKAEKSKHEVEINRLKKLKNILMPGGKLQERSHTLLDIPEEQRTIFMDKLTEQELNTMNIITL